MTKLSTPQRAGRPERIEAPKPERRFWCIVNVHMRVELVITAITGMIVALWRCGLL
jgi:hypothetical protein